PRNDGSYPERVAPAPRAGTARHLGEVAPGTRGTQREAPSMTGTTPQDLRSRIERYVSGVPAGEERAARESVDALRDALATGSGRGAPRNAHGEGTPTTW